MFKQVGKSANTRLLRRLHSHASSSGSRKVTRAAIGGSILLASAALAGSQLSDGLTIYNDADLVFEKKKPPKEIEIPAVEDKDGKLRAVVWGSNRYVHPLVSVQSHTVHERVYRSAYLQ